MADSTPKSYSTDPALYLYTSLTAGSSHIVTATSRMETILKANKIPFKALDIATDEKARMLWGRRAGKDESGRARKIPGLVQMGLVIGDIVEVEDWNEYGELKQHIKIYREGETPAKSATPTPSGTPSKVPTPAPPPPPPAAPQSLKAVETPPKPAAAPQKAVEEPSKPPVGAQPTSISLAMRQLGQEAAQKAKDGMKRSRKVTETFSGAGRAEPAKKSLEKSAAVPRPISVETSTEKYAIETRTLLQSPTSSAWKNDANEKPSIPHEFQKVESLQSPTSTSWKLVTEHTGSLEPVATRKEVDKLEEHKAASKDEDEDDEEDEEDGDEDEEEDEQEEKKKEDEDEDDDEEADDEEEEDEEEDLSNDD